LRLGQPSQWEFRYYCSRGFVLQDLAAGRLEIHPDDGETVVAPELPPAELYPAGAPVRRLIDLVLGEGDNPAPGNLGAHVVDVVDAAYRSAEAHGAPVHIQEPAC
jgi:predicted dehydrogenase